MAHKESESRKVMAWLTHVYMSTGSFGLPSIPKSQRPLYAFLYTAFELGFTFRLRMPDNTVKALNFDEFQETTALLGLVPIEVRYLSFPMSKEIRKLKRIGKADPDEQVWGIIEDIIERVLIKIMHKYEFNMYLLGKMNKPKGYQTRILDKLGRVEVSKDIRRLIKKYLKRL